MFLCGIICWFRDKKDCCELKIQGVPWKFKKKCGQRIEHAPIQAYRLHTKVGEERHDQRC